MPPSNISFATAVVIGSLPYSITQSDINDGGVNYTVYYKFIAPANARVIGAWAFSGNLAGYKPIIRPYDGPAGSPVVILGGVAGENVPIQFPVVPGNEYFLELQKNGNSAGPEHIDLAVEVAPLSTIANGNIAVNDDTQGFPTAILSHLVDYTTINFIKDTASGEAGDVLPDGEIILENVDDGHLRVYDSSFAQVADLDLSTAGAIRIRSCIAADKFYVSGARGSYGTDIYTVSKAGILSAVLDTMPGYISGVAAIAAKNDESVLYYANAGYNQAIKRWDLVNHVGLSDLVAGVANYKCVDILYLSDDTLIVGYARTSTRDIVIKQYDTTGATLNTYNLGVSDAGDGMDARLAYAIDEPNSFWAWTHHAGNISKFRNIKCNDGSVLTTRLHMEFEGGEYQGADTDTPLARFGNSYSCPFFIIRVAFIPTPQPGGIYYINSSKSEWHDSYYGSIEKKIPNPTFRTALIGE